MPVCQASTLVEVLITAACSINLEWSNHFAERPGATDLGRALHS